MSYQRIADAVGVNRGTVYRWVKKDYARWQAAHAAAERDPLPTGPASPPVETVSRVTDDDPEWRTFLTALQVTGRIEHARAIARVDPARVARWQLERREEIEHARSTLVLRNAKILHQIAGSPEATNRDRMGAVDRLQQWTAVEPAVGSGPIACDGIPPTPALPPDGPSDERCPACPADTCRGHCPLARWRAWLDRVCWARSQPGATDLIALRSAGDLASLADVAAWLDEGRADLASGDDSAAGRFAICWASAVGDAVGTALRAHAAALAAGAGAATRAALDTLAAIAPEEYGGRGDPRRLLAGDTADEPVARILQITYAADEEPGSEPDP